MLILILEISFIQIHNYRDRKIMPITGHKHDRFASTIFLLAMCDK